MPKKLNKRLVAGLDIGTTKVVVLIAEITPEGALEVIGMGSCPSKGLKKGVVVNMDATVQAVKAAVEEAELMAGCRLESVYTGIAGSHIKSFNSHGMIAIRHHEVTSADIDRVLEAAQAVAIPADQKVLQVLPQEFTIDLQEGIKEPLGMSGVRLETKIHIVTGGLSAIQNIVKCVERCGLAAQDVILQPLASSYAVLTDDEKQLGVCLVDMGGGTTDLAFFAEGAIRHSAVFPIAGDQVTNDLAVALRVPTAYAEQAKVAYGCAYTATASEEALAEIPSVGERPARCLSRRALAEIIEPRFEELFCLIQSEIVKQGWHDKLGAGIVLTGGSAQMEGMIELAEAVFQLPVRLGAPKALQGLTELIRNPIYSTVVGLLLYSHENKQKAKGWMNGSGIKGLWGRMRHWIQRNF